MCTGVAASVSLVLFVCLTAVMFSAVEIHTKSPEANLMLSGIATVIEVIIKSFTLFQSSLMIFDVQLMMIFSSVK